MIVEDKTITSSPFGTEQASHAGGSPAQTTPDRVELFKANSDFVERVKKAFQETRLLEPLPVVISPKCCPHCWLHEPFGMGYA